MTPAFWDASALVPLCVRQQPSPVVQGLVRQLGIVVWWATPVEMRGAFERLLRTGELKASDYAAAGVRLERLRSGWRELQPSEPLRAHAESFLTLNPLKAADALQLAAAWTWCSGNAKSCTFISADTQLLEAARRLNFQILPV